jgi:hypothetical protein
MAQAKYCLASSLKITVCIFIIVTSAERVFTQATSAADKRLTETISQFDATDWESRVHAFYDLFALGLPGGLKGRTTLIPSALSSLFRQGAGRKDQICIALIKLLATEYKTSHGPTNPASEAYADYLGDLVAAVAAIHDPRALNGLLGYIETGDIATRGLAALGRDSLEPVLQIVNSVDRGLGRETARRMGATRVLSEMLDPDIVQIDEASRAKIKSGLLRASRDKQSWVRLIAVEGLARIPDPDVIIALRSLLEQDPYTRLDRSEHLVYPIREAARKALGARGPAVKQ